MRSRKFRIKITRSGYIYIFLTIVLGVGAANTGNNLLYLLTSLMLSLMLLSGLTSLQNLLFLNVSVIPPREIFAEIPAQFTLMIRKARFNSFFLQFETPFGKARVSFLKGERETSLWLQFPQRGLARVDDLRIHSAFPLGFFRRFNLHPLGLEVTVFPKPAYQPLPSLTGASQSNGNSGDFLREISDEIKDLRGYRESDQLKWVDWKATARRGEMVVREFYHLKGDSLVIDLSRRQGRWEQRISGACFLILEGHKRGLLISLVMADREIPPGRGEKQKKDLLEALAFA